jgi:hypothetical protein
MSQFLSKTLWEPYHSPQVKYRNDSNLNNVQLGYLEVTVQENLRSGWPGPFVKVEGCCD